MSDQERMQTEPKNQSDPDVQVGSEKQDDLEKLYAVEFRSQSYASYFNTIMEKDKSILTLSVAGIGFLLTVLQLSEKLSITQFIIFIAAAFLFVISIFCMIVIFSKNGDLIIDMVTEKNTEVIQYKLKVLDKVAITSFVMAIILSIIFGGFGSISKVEFGEMSNEKTIQPSSEQKISGTANDSFERIGSCNESFQAVADLGKSFSGANAMKPSVAKPSESNPVSTNPTSSNPTGVQALKPKV